MMRALVAVTGPIAAGATTLSNLFIERIGWKPALEIDVERENPFFAKYHADPSRFAFHNQITFLTHSAEGHSRLRRSESSDAIRVQDYTPFEHTEVYGRTLHKLGRLSDDELAVLERITTILSH